MVIWLSFPFCRVTTPVRTGTLEDHRPDLGSSFLWPRCCAHWFVSSAWIGDTQPLEIFPGNDLLSLRMAEVGN